MPEITRARAERNPLPSPLAKLQAGLKLVNKTETPMRIFALQDQLKLCEDSRSQTAALISASLPKCKANKILALDSEKNKYTRIVFHVFGLERHQFTNQGGQDTVQLFPKKQCLQLYVVQEC